MTITEEIDLGDKKIQEMNGVQDLEETPEESGISLKDSYEVSGTKVKIKKSRSKSVLLNPQTLSEASP